MNETDATRRLLDGFDRQAAEMGAAAAKCTELRAEQAALRVGWSDLVQGGDYNEIARRSMRLGEIGIELARLGQ